MSVENKISVKEQLPKKIINSLIINNSLKTVIDNIFTTKDTEFDDIQSPLYFLKKKKGLPNLINIIYEFKDKLTLSDIKEIPDNNTYLSLHEKNENRRINGMFNITKQRMVIETTENKIILSKYFLKLTPEEWLEINKNKYSSKLRSNNKKDEESKNNLKDNDLKNINKNNNKINSLQNGEHKLCGFKKKFSKKIILPSKIIKGNNVLLQNIEKDKLPKGLLIDNIDNYIDEISDEISFEEEYTKKYFVKNKLDSQLLELQNKKLGKDIRLGSHFNKDKEGNIYLFNISIYGENGLIKMKCSNQSCKATALYNFISKTFYLVDKHTISAENHKLRNLPTFKILDYVNFMGRHPDVFNLQILKVPKDKFSKIYCITYVNEKEALFKIDKDNDPEVNDEMSQYVYEYDYNINDGNEEEEKGEEKKEK